MLELSDEPRQVAVVSDFPSRPDQNIAYSLAGAKKVDVTHGTHSFHKYPAKFIPHIPRWALKNLLQGTRGTVLDPFCGSGTTLVEAGRLGHHAIGVDISPLAALITRAKCVTVTGDMVENWLDKLPYVLLHAGLIAREVEGNLATADGALAIGLHHTWSNWFDAKTAAQLVALRMSLSECVPEEQLRVCLLASLSSIVKSCSSLNEDQIKVRLDSSKKIAEPFQAFSEASLAFLTRQQQLAREYESAGASFEVYQGSATSLPLADESVDLAVTSPPYINAVDYTMAHKYNLFMLGLLDPECFKQHCREYVGVTERAVRSQDLVERAEAKVASVRPWVSRVAEIGNATAHNRAFVVTQYFDGMFRSFEEILRALRPRAKCFMVVGESNRICGVRIPTAELVLNCAESAGLKPTLQFRHALANKSAMRLSRSTTGGEIPFERVLVFERPQ